ncbi:hypothetical protein F0U44_15200 [Nocardioides humilatus]|uniref:NlpC/P60 domain-containing protein n=1 Tax=Nocardioides humilatus TaxID=2607660 RepID=A0A5B1LCP5_9ACTN|nr:C40 family peptidase [Nocardioides humilatus]KAA1417978.1 hypothetical protein F0U44_15200 [Nocardioides humilatus]
MLNGRTRFTTALSALALTGTVCLTVNTSSPASAEPDIDDVRARVDSLFEEAEHAQERYNDAKVELDELNEELASLQSDEVRQGDQVARVRSDVRDSVIRQFQSQSLSPAAQLINADEDAFLNSLSTLTTVSDLQESLLSDYNDELKAYAIRRKETADRRNQVADLEEELKDEKETVEEKYNEAKDLLGDLEAKEREAILSRGGDIRAEDISVSASGRAAAAVQYAMAQVGDAYVYGAAGPSAYDCSGLTMMAWAQAGVSLPHSSSAQYGMGPHIAESALQPGDLVFYYSPISHVGMYIGNGMIVHAANPGAGVLVSPLHYMPYVGAVRPG